MKKIICPTDLSPTANNAIEYAAKLAQKINAELEIFNVQVISAASPIASGIEVSENTATTAAILNKMQNEISRTFNISCKYNITTTTETLEKAIGKKATESNLIVMGTNGTDDLYQYIFGTNTYQVIRKSKCPLLIVPEGVNFKSIRKIVFAWDYSRDNKESFFQLKELLGIFNAEITFLHISKEKSPVSDDVFSALKEDVHSYLGEKENILFDRIYSEDMATFADRMDEYMDDSNADLLAVTYYDRGALNNLFHGTITKGLSEIAGYPLLVLHV